MEEFHADDDVTSAERLGVFLGFPSYSGRFLFKL